MAESLVLTSSPGAGMGTKAIRADFTKRVSTCGEFYVVSCNIWCTKSLEVSGSSNPSVFDLTKEIVVENAS